MAKSSIDTIINYINTTDLSVVSDYILEDLQGVLSQDIRLDVFDYENDNNADALIKVLEVINARRQMRLLIT